MGGSILVVDDEAAVRDLLAANLQRAGYKVMCAGDVPQAEALVRDTRPDMVLLDWVLPGIPGLTFARRLRSDQRTKDISIVLLTARAEEQDKVTALESGVDDYVTKPFSARELLARIKAVLRRLSEPEELLPTTLEAGPVRMDVERHVVTVRGDQRSLPLKEFELLEMLLRNAGRVLTRMQLIDRVWGSDYVGDTKTLDVHIKRLRAKVESDPAAPRHILTVRGLGYKFEA